MAINEQILTGRKWRRLIDKAAGLWQRISYWTHSSDVEFNDGKNAETKVGAIDGITDSLASTSSRIAASAKSVNQLSNDLAQQPNFIYDATGKITGYKTPGGADTVFPFNNGNFEITLLSSTRIAKGSNTHAYAFIKVKLTFNEFKLISTEVLEKVNANVGTSPNVWTIIPEYINVEQLSN